VVKVASSLMMDAARFSETSVPICQITLHNTVQNSNLHGRELHNLKSKGCMKMPTAVKIVLPIVKEYTVGGNQIWKYFELCESGLADGEKNVCDSRVRSLSQKRMFTY
jgi:hypothetical protein